MKKSPLLFLSFVALALCSFAIFESQQAAPPVEEAVFKQYLASFDEVQLPYKLSMSNQKWKAKKALSNDYAHFIPEIMSGQFSRSGPTAFYPEVVLASNKDFKTVIYAETMPWDMEDASFNIQTINKKGDVISSFYLTSLRGDANSYCEIKSNLDIVSYDGETKQTRKLKINKAGKISQTKAG